MTNLRRRWAANPNMRLIPEYRVRMAWCLGDPEYILVRDRVYFVDPFSAEMHVTEQVIADGFTSWVGALRYLLEEELAEDVPWHPQW